MTSYALRMKEAEEKAELYRSVADLYRVLGDQTRVAEAEWKVVQQEKQLKIQI